MKEYFKLQYKMTNRKLMAFGAEPFLAYILLVLFFFAVSTYLFFKTQFASYLYILIAFSFFTKLSNKKRNDFLKLSFTKKGYLKIRMLENVGIALPFTLFLAYQKCYIFIPILLSLAVLSSLLNLNKPISFIIPTPFYKKPFEFTVGFRNTFFIFPVAYFLTYISISVNNFNLGIFSLLLIFLVSLSYYAKLETVYYIWSYNLAPKNFLMQKIRTGVLHTTILSLPILIPLAIFFNTEITTLLTFLLLGYGYLLTVILAKYSVYPNEMNIPQGILISIGLIFPPFLIGLIPYFYHQATTQLKSILV